MTSLRVAFRRPWPTKRRGLKLWVISIIILIKGLTYVNSNAEATESSLRLLTMEFHIPVPALGWWIIALSCFAIFTSYCHFGRDRYGYSALIGFSAFWGACYAVAPLFLDGPAYAWQGATTWLLIMLFLSLCAADPDDAVNVLTSAPIKKDLL